MRIKILILMCTIWYEECLVAWISPPPKPQPSFYHSECTNHTLFCVMLGDQWGFHRRRLLFSRFTLQSAAQVVGFSVFLLLRHVCFVPHLFLVPRHDVCLPPWPSETWPVTLLLLHNPIPPWAFQCVAGKIPDAAHNLFQSYGLMIWRGLGGMR